MNDARTYTAACACGQLSLTVAGPPQAHGVCHCLNCQRRTGSAFGISMYFPRAAVRLIDGESQVYAFHHAAQRHDQVRHFCGICGTTLYWMISTLPEVIGVAGGGFAGQDLGTPTYSVSEAGRRPWVGLPAGWAHSD